MKLSECSLDSCMSLCISVVSVVTSPLSDFVSMCLSDFVSMCQTKFLILFLCVFFLFSVVRVARGFSIY